MSGTAAAAASKQSSAISGFLSPGNTHPGFAVDKDFRHSARQRAVYPLMRFPGHYKEAARLDGLFGLALEIPAGISESLVLNQLFIA